MWAIKQLQYLSLVLRPIDSTIDDKIEHYSIQNFQWLFTQKSPIAQMKCWYVKTWLIPLVSDYYSSRIDNQ